MSDTLVDVDVDAEDWYDDDDYPWGYTDDTYDHYVDYDNDDDDAYDYWDGVIDD